MKFIIVSGRSGSGKTTALQILEDLSFYCVDNLPLNLLPNLAEQIHLQNTTQASDSNGTIPNKKNIQDIAIGIDARNLTNHLGHFSETLSQLAQLSVECQVIFIDAHDEILLNRFHASRRKHPLSNEQTSLIEAISQEETLLKPIESFASLTVDSSFLTIHQLREQIKQHIYHNKSQQTSILIQSFSYKHGVPIDADIVFDVRCLINPHWQADLQILTGLDKAVQDYLNQDVDCLDMIQDIENYFKRWIPVFEKNNRSYLSIAIGCTGGQHRSVYVSETLAKRLDQSFSKIQIRHRELNR